VNVICAVVIVSVSTSLSVPLSVAQSADSGRIVGRVTDVFGVIPGAEVRADAPGVHRESVTDSHGRFEICDVPTSDRPYTVTFTLPGYRTQTASVVVAQAGQAVAVDVQLEPPPGIVDYFVDPYEALGNTKTFITTADAVVYVRLSKSVKITVVGNVQNVDDTATIVDAAKMPPSMANDTTIQIRLLCSADHDVPSELLLFLHADSFGHFVGNVKDCIGVSRDHVYGWSDAAAGIAPDSGIDDVMTRLRALLKPPQ